MNILQLWRCALGRHKRDRRLVKHDGEDFRSVCTGCRRQMIRREDGWHLAKAADAAWRNISA
jgi:hypothetical protein